MYIIISPKLHTVQSFKYKSRWLFYGACCTQYTYVQGTSSKDKVDHKERIKITLTEQYAGY